MCIRDSLRQLVDHYWTTTKQIPENSFTQGSNATEVSRMKRFILEAALFAGGAGGVLVAELAEQALSAIGFSRHTTEDRKIVNENTARSKVLTVHLKGVERAVHTLKVHEHDLQQEEGATTKMIHLIAGLDTIFDEIHRVFNGMETLFHSKQATPLLVDPVALYVQIKELEHEVASENERLLVSTPSDVWHAPTSYFVTGDLLSLIHI